MSGSKLEFEAEWQTKPDHSDMAVQTHGETTAAETTGIYNFQRLLLLFLLGLVEPWGTCIVCIPMNMKICVSHKITNPF